VQLLLASAIVACNLHRVKQDGESVAKEHTMSVARVIEISAISEKSFEDAIRQGIERANRTLRNVESAWIKDQNVMIDDGNITGYRVNMQVTFVLDDMADNDPAI
jgi:hypothetical protein